MRIGDFAAACGVNPKTVRFYEQQGLLPAPERTPAGYRDYQPQAATRVHFIRDAQRAGLSLAEIRGVLTLRDNGQAPCGHVAHLIEQHLEDIDRRLADLRSTRAALTALARRAANTDPSTCVEEAICTILTPPQL